MAHDLIPTAPSDAGLVALLLQQLRVWKGNPRKVVGDLSDLAASIRAHGILEPLLVRAVVPHEVVEIPPPADAPEGTLPTFRTITHEILAGQRRFLAAVEAGSDSAPCLIRDVPDDEALELGLVENGQRKDPSPLEDAVAMNALIVDHGRTVEQIADKLGRDKRFVLRRLSLLGLIDTAREWLLSGRLPLAHAHQLAAVDASVQQTVINQYAQADDLPSSRVFARDIARALHPLVAAPFDINDASMPGGSCGPCPHRSDTQPDLFGPADNERCLKSSCWDAKVAHVWEKAQRGARRRHLAVLNEPVIVGLNDTVTGTSYVTKGANGAKPVAIARTHGGHVHELFERPIPASAPEPPPVAHAADEDEEDDGAAEKRRAAREEVRKAQQEAEETRRRAILSRLTTVASTPEGLALVQRVALLSMLREWSAGGELRGVCEALGMPAFGPSVDLVADVSDARIGRVLAATGAAAWALDPDAEDDEKPEKRLRALLNSDDAPTTRCGDCAEVEALAKRGAEPVRCFCGRVYDPPSAEAPPASAEPMYRVLVIPDDADWLKLVKGLSGFSAEKNPGAGSSSGGSCRPLREVHTHAGHSDLGKLIDRLNKASIPYLDMGEVTRAQVFDCAPTFRQVRERWNAAHPTRPVTIGDGEPGWAPVESPPAPNGTRLWITEKVWDGLTDDLRTMLCQPDVGVEEIVWEGREGHVTAVVSDEETLKAFKSLAKEHRVKFHEGDEPPAKRSKAVKS